MAEKLPMLALSPTMEQGIIVQWLKKEGDKIENGDTICEVETDKAVMDYQAMVDGVLLKIVIEEGKGAGVGDTIAIVGEEGEEFDESQLEAPPPPVEQPKAEEDAPTAEAAPEVPKAPTAVKTSPGGKVRATPAARGLAAEKGIDISQLQGSGPGGRVIMADIDAAVAAGLGGQVQAPVPFRAVSSQPVPVNDGDEVLPLSEKRKVIAQRLSESMFTAPHYYLRLSVWMDELLSVRTRLNGMRGEKLSLNAFLIKMTAQALKMNPVVNSSWNTDSIVQHKSIDIALAVAVEGGLITPVVRDCAGKSIAEIDAELKVLIEKAKVGKLQPDEYTNATFTISNLGSFGIEEFTAIINPPGSAILAVGKTVRTPVVDDDDQIVIKSVMNVTTSCDHRVIDGAVGAKFMSDLKAMLEEPALALA